MKRSKNLEKDFVVLSPKGLSEVWKADDFWRMAFDASHKKNDKNMGYLVSSYEFDEDWSSWENHPNGDEFVFCISGNMTVLMQERGKVRRVKVKAGNFIIIPKNTWHTAQLNEPTKALFVTWGYGTKHRPVKEV